MFIFPRAKENKSLPEAWRGWLKAFPFHVRDKLLSLIAPWNWTADLLMALTMKSPLCEKEPPGAPWLNFDHRRHPESTTDAPQSRSGPQIMLRDMNSWHSLRLAARSYAHVLVFQNAAARIDGHVQRDHSLGATVSGVAKSRPRAQRSF